MAASLGKVIELIEKWRPRSCETEKDYEKSLARHLQKNLEKSDTIKQYASGRVKGDIVVDGKILTEIKKDLDSTSKVQRLLGQIDIYATNWKGKVVIVSSGDHQPDLMKMVKAKIDALSPGFF